jgi:cell division protease FtsH
MNSEERKKLVAYHEAGHAVVGLLTPGFDEIEKVTIVPRSGGAGGFTLFTPSDERQDLGMFSQRYLKDQLAVALGGRVAEELVFGEEEVTHGTDDAQDPSLIARVVIFLILSLSFTLKSIDVHMFASALFVFRFLLPVQTTTGASNDLQKVADVARKMVTQWGFASKKLSSTAWEPPSGSAFGMPQMASQATQEKIDVQVAAIVDGAYRDCQEKLTTNRKLLDEMVLELVQKENLGRADIKRLQELYAKTPPTKAKSSAENAKEGFKRLLFDE